MEILTTQHLPSSEKLTNTQAKKRLYYVTSCAYCGIDGTFTHGPDGNFWHIDHVYPISKGGQNYASNLVKACALCNTAKADNTGRDWQPRRGTMTAALHAWTMSKPASRPKYQSVEAYVRDLEDALEEHRAALENLRQRIQIAALVERGQMPQW